MNITVGILTISDRCSKGEAKDKSGPTLQEMINKSDWKVTEYKIVPDETKNIKDTLTYWTDEKRLALILTTGGTGLGTRDITPETTLEIIDKELPGFSELIRMEGYKIAKNAVLSRGVCGVKNKTIILNLPGSPKGACESFEIVRNLIPHAIDMINGKEHK